MVEYIHGVFGRDRKSNKMTLFFVEARDYAQFLDLQGLQGNVMRMVIIPVRKETLEILNSLKPQERLEAIQKTIDNHTDLVSN